MKKAMVSLLTVALLLSGMTAVASAAWGEDGVAIFINDESFAPPADFEVIHGITYVPIRAFCTAMDAQAAVVWEKGLITVAAPGLSMHVAVGSGYLEANGRYFYIPDGCYLLNGNAMAPIRTLAAAFGASVEWDGENRRVRVVRGLLPIESGETHYNAQEVYWLSRIIEAESSGEPFAGKVAVGEVVLNRVASPDYPANVYDVIFDTQYGVQFSPIADGSIYCEPSLESIIAAKAALEGVHLVDGCLFFQNESVTGSNWMSAERTFVVKLGAHSFYA